MCQFKIGGNEDNLDLILVPGAFEIPFALEKALSSGKYDAVCCVLLCLVVQVVVEKPAVVQVVLD